MALDIFSSRYKSYTRIIMGIHQIDAHEIEKQKTGNATDQSILDELTTL